MQAPHLVLGQDVEDAALDYFLKHAPMARLLERNRRFRCGEIDLVFEEGSSQAPELVFVEVRARSGGGLARGYETIGAAKRRRLGRAIRAYLARYRGPARSLRVDILSWDSGEWTHLRNVWL